MSRKRWQGRPKAAALSRRAGTAASSLLHHPRVWWRQRRCPDAIVTTALAAAEVAMGRVILAKPTGSGACRQGPVWLWSEASVLPVRPSAPAEDKERTISEQEPRPGEGSYGQGGTAWGAGQSQPPPPPGAPPWSSSPYPPAPTAAQRVRSALRARAGTDYIFNFWSSLGWTVLTLGFYSYYVFYQLMRRMRDHCARRVELLDATLSFAWEDAGRRGLQEELTPAFQRAAWHLAVMRQMAAGSLEPVIWLVLSIVASAIVHVVAFILLDQDLVKHDEAEVGVEYELATIFGRLGYSLPFPDAHRLKGRHNYVGRIVATFFSFGIYFFWWYYNMMQEPNVHFRANWSQEDVLAAVFSTMPGVVPTTW
jgi:hypothetical protein